MTQQSDEVDWPIPIAQLAERVGMTARNIRAHQSRGLLPPPEHRGRIACYGRQHEAILLRIKELQAKGYNLAAITELLQSSDEVVALQRLVLRPLLESDDVVITRRQMSSMFGTSRDDERLQTALDVGLLEDMGDDRYLMPSRHVLEAARQLRELGMPIIEFYDMQVEVVRATRDLARRFVEISLRCALGPYEAGGVPPERWAEVEGRFEKLRRLTASALAGTFSMNVRRATQELLAERDLPSGHSGTAG